jgi:hypothetical protein
VPGATGKVDREGRSFLARGTGAAGAADAVDIIVRMPGRVEVEHVADALDVEPARGDVGGHEDVDVPALKRSSSAMRADWSMSPWISPR